MWTILGSNFLLAPQVQCNVGVLDREIGKNYPDTGLILASQCAKYTIKQTKKKTGITNDRHFKCIRFIKAAFKPIVRAFSC